MIHESLLLLIPFLNDRIIFIAISVLPHLCNQEHISGGGSYIRHKVCKLKAKSSFLLWFWEFHSGGVCVLF